MVSFKLPETRIEVINFLRSFRLFVQMSRHGTTALYFRIQTQSPRSPPRHPLPLSYVWSYEHTLNDEGNTKYLRKQFRFPIERSPLSASTCVSNYLLTFSHRHDGVPSEHSLNYLRQRYHLLMGLVSTCRQFCVAVFPPNFSYIFAADSDVYFISGLCIFEFYQFFICF